MNTMKFKWKTWLTLLGSIFLLYLCIEYWPVVAKLLASTLVAAVPLLVGCAMAYVINILMSFYEKRYFPKSNKSIIGKTRRPICLVAAVLTILAIITLVVGLIVPQLISCVKLLVAEIPDATMTVVRWLQDKGILSGEWEQTLSEINWQDVWNKVGGWLTSGIGSVVDLVVQTVSSVISVVVTVFLGLVFALYLLASKETLGRQCNKLMDRVFSGSITEKIRNILSVVNDCFHKYIVGQCTEAVVLGILCFVGMLILRLPYAAMVSALIAFTALIPVAGAYIGAVVGAFMILTESPIKALIFLIFLIILQQLEGNLIYPKVVGSSLELPAIWVLAAVTLGGGILGIPGMLLGVPLTAAVYRMIKGAINTPKQATTKSKE